MSLRNEYPRPQFVRDKWLNLNGEWDFTYDDQDRGVAEHWYQTPAVFDKKIQVPFAYQSKLSGINERNIHDVVWYQREFELVCKEEKEYYLHFGAVDYQADVYLNQQYVGRHQGGHTSFSFEVSHLLKAEGLQTLTLRVWDPAKDETIPRGKQFWEEESRGIWYTNTTGIWQTVWLEEVEPCHFENLRLTPKFDEGAVHMAINVPEVALGKKIRYQISFKETLLCEDEIKILETEINREVALFTNKIFRTNFHDNGWTWTPEHPNLFDVKIVLVDEQIVLDEVTSYFGMRKIHTENGMTFLNNYPYYQKLVLDQGYWPDGLLTAPTDEAFVEDIKIAKAMGFNGCRKHQKVEDPRFLYWADQLGFLVWGECASAPVYTPTAAARLTEEWIEIINRDYNHPSIVSWVPLNESWGVPGIHLNHQQQSFAKSIYHFLHALDTTRLVISNDGWEMTETDICAIHNYNHGAKSEVKKYQHFKKTLADADNLINLPPGKWDIFAKGANYQGQPILLTEFGGIGYKIGAQSGWGYTSVENAEEFIEEYGRIMDALYTSTALWGYCYTQLTDVEQEINGLVTYDRQPKADFKAIKAINDQFYPERIFVAKD
ncbi:beta-galactosidase/beta-glucuronidase [Enterococcus sp. PF1-24]|uniref:glycoside hydrolase family 2 protein n=1 Tax=unclassified Enterococcus TaxID=2608891 RepID=UPI0024758F06|nr:MULTISPECIES: sugar-binding domain-containing protein [unclassified Enterococcus]MDH6365731.1 beta-galactosidase/beta-glucuronidase [Enterococcus sp. PFB1-1]MDH6402828.1 beta-galactosidase/beta-glucuronidase [Enterococcus sp. PF1-24]